MSLEAVIGAFAARLAELREITLLRVDDNVKDLYTKDLEAIETTVRALELKLKEIKAYVKKEKEAIPRACALIDACKQQSQQLDHIASHLPTFLPSLLNSPIEGNQVLQERGINAVASNRGDNSKKAAQHAAPSNVSTQQPPPTIPRRYITQEEFESISTYMRGRLTADKLNAALEEIITKAETTATLVNAARRNRPLGSERKHAQWLLYNVANHDALKEKRWVLESDLKSGAALRLDKSGKTMLTLLRHLGRLTETRMAVDGTTHLVYALVV